MGFFIPKNPKREHQLTTMGPTRTLWGTRTSLSLVLWYHPWDEPDISDIYQKSRYTGIWYFPIWYATGTGTFTGLHLGMVEFLW